MRRQKNGSNSKAISAKAKRKVAANREKRGIVASHGSGINRVGHISHQRM